jgi:hypothetical protein
MSTKRGRKVPTKNAAEQQPSQNTSGRKVPANNTAEQQPPQNSSSGRESIKKSVKPRKKPLPLKRKRTCFYQALEDETELTCPRCDNPLENHPEPLIMVTRRGEEITDQFIFGNDCAWYCRQCPTVLINTNKINWPHGHPKYKWNVGDEFAILGIADLEALPDDAILGDPNSPPLPIIAFSHMTWEGEKSDGFLPMEVLDRPQQRKRPWWKFWERE